MISTMADWRAAADPDDLREYDRFGPWIDRVVDAVDMPRRFRPWWSELSQARYLLKVPRSYDRAQIRPGMDLYESMIAVFPDRVGVLRADPAEVVRRDVARDEVVATIRHTNLLIARWTLLLADGSSVEVEYNSVSEAVVAEVDRYLMTSPKPAASSPTTSPALMPQEHFFRSVLIDLNNQSDLPVQPIHIEEPRQPCRTDRGRRRRSFGMMALASADDLLLFNRDLTVQSLLRRPNYAANIIRIPIRGITSFELRTPEAATPPYFSQLVLVCDRQVITQPCLIRPDAVEHLLAQQVGEGEPDVEDARRIVSRPFLGEGSLKKTVRGGG